MNKKSLATALVLASAVFAASAGPVVQQISTDTTIGAVGFGTDYLANDGNNVNWTVSTTQPKGSAFTDTYDFTLAAIDDVTAYAQVVGNTKTWALTGASGELQLYEGIYTPGHALSTYTLVDQATFSTSLAPTLIDHLAAGNYFFAVEGKTAGTSGGRYYFEVTAVPEPANAALLLAGLCLVGTLAKRRKTN